MANPEIVELGRNNLKNYANVVEEIVKIEKKLFPKHESLATVFDGELKKKNCGLLYSHINGEVTGYVMYQWPSSLFASITKLAVKENYRRQGHGEALLKAAIEKCRTRHIQRVQLHVDPSRTAARNLYQKIGFQIDRLIEGYYSMTRDAYVMYMEFTDA
ncbi:GNAT domain [Macleaya cordata]|uniref:GNAT domain n=1 Tax=Macleaya cordata TaxID=56857 RepID=A0A200QS09_MACCD|nr:GNAT domain [Macleaya cordata]